MILWHRLKFHLFFYFLFFWFSNGFAMKTDFLEKPAYLICVIWNLETVCCPLRMFARREAARYSRDLPWIKLFFLKSIAAVFTLSRGFLAPGSSLLWLVDSTPMNVNRISWTELLLRWVRSRTIPYYPLHHPHCCRVWFQHNINGCLSPPLPALYRHNCSKSMYLKSARWFMNVIISL